MSNTVASINYLDPKTESSLYSTGALYMDRDTQGSDTNLHGVTFAQVEVEIIDGRAPSAGAAPTVDRHGFGLIDAPLADRDLDFLDMQPVVERYYAECAEHVRDATGASSVVAFDHNVRSPAAKERAEQISGGQEVQGPARVVHGDYTLKSAPQRLEDFASPPRANDTYRRLLSEGETLLPRDEVERMLDGGRYAFINLWRNIDEHPIESDPLILCDARTVSREDLSVFEIRYADRVGENYWAKHSPEHAWYGFPEIDRDEALLIKQWDSAGPLARSDGAHGDASDPGSPCTFSFHTAYFDPATMTGRRPRWSIEVRCVAFYD